MLPLVVGGEAVVHLATWVTHAGDAGPVGVAEGGHDHDASCVVCNLAGCGLLGSGCTNTCS